MKIILLFLFIIYFSNYSIAGIILSTLSRLIDVPTKLVGGFIEDTRKAIDGNYYSSESPYYVFINEATTPRQLHINIKGGGSIKKLGVQNIANFHGVPEGKR